MFGSSSWPSPADYSTALQNPQNRFRDSDLRAGTARRNKFGLPIGVSGNFAVVYELECNSALYAVRCFIRPIPENQQERYDALTAFQKSTSIKCLVDSLFMDQAILVRGKWYPIVKMEWASGQQLHRYIESNLGNPDRLTRLAAKWLDAMTQLKSAGVAHGDLHHGNVLVDDEGEITLVDYDGFYVPAMHDKPPGEVGHPNYQLPERIENGYYEANADAFSSLLIYVTILAVRSDREIWAHHNGDNLIFVDQDFKSLGWPGVWTQLRQNPDPEVRRLSRLLEQFCKLPPASLPDLSTVVNNEVEVVAGAAQVTHQT